MQATADLTQIPIEVYPSSHATALGAAACARMATDPTLSVERRYTRLGRGHTYQPQWSADRAADFRQTWRAAVAATLPTEKAAEFP